MSRKTIVRRAWTIIWRDLFPDEDYRDRELFEFQIATMLLLVAGCVWLWFVLRQIWLLVTFVPVALLSLGAWAIGKDAQRMARRFWPWMKKPWILRGSPEYHTHPWDREG